MTEDLEKLSQELRQTAEQIATLNYLAWLSKPDK